MRLEYIEIPDVKIPKGTPDDRVCATEGAEILKRIAPGDYVILLDESGSQFSSEELAMKLQKRFNSGGKALVLLIGGPYGFDPKVQQRAEAKWSLSRLTFSHQMVRLIALEQLYRAMTILRNEPYHHGG